MKCFLCIIGSQHFSCNCFWNSYSSCEYIVFWSFQWLLMECWSIWSHLLQKQMRMLAVSLSVVWLCFGIFYYSSDSSSLLSGHLSPTPACRLGLFHPSLMSTYPSSLVHWSFVSQVKIRSASSAAGMTCCVILLIFSHYEVVKTQLPTILNILNRSTRKKYMRKTNFKPTE